MNIVKSGSFRPAIKLVKSRGQLLRPPQQCHRRSAHPRLVDWPAVASFAKAESEARYWEWYNNMSEERRRQLEYLKETPGELLLLEDAHDTRIKRLFWDEVECHHDPDHYRLILLRPQLLAYSRVVETRRRPKTKKKTYMAWRATQPFISDEWRDMSRKQRQAAWWEDSERHRDPILWERMKKQFDYLEIWTTPAYLEYKTFSAGWWEREQLRKETRKLTKKSLIWFNTNKYELGRVKHQVWELRLLYEKLKRGLWMMEREAKKLDVEPPMEEPLPFIRKYTTKAGVEPLPNSVAGPAEERHEESMYKTTLPVSQIFEGAIGFLTPALFHASNYDLETPLLIHGSATHSSPSSGPTTKGALRSLAMSSGMHAIAKWFNPPSTAHAPFTTHLAKHGDTLYLPYELLTPILPLHNDGTHDPLTTWLQPTHALFAPLLPPAGSLTHLLSQCLAHLASTSVLDAGIDYAALAGNPWCRQRFLSLTPGVPMDAEQWFTLHKYGPLFQTFQRFTAPLSLLLRAALPLSPSPSTSSPSPLPTPALPGLYIAQAQLADLPASLLTSLPLPRLLSTFHLHDTSKPGRELADIYGANLWLGTPPTFTPLHRDPNPNFFAQLRGRKVVRMLPPMEGGALFRRVMSGVKGRGGGGMVRGVEMMEGGERWAMERAVWGECEGEGRDGDGEVLMQSMRTVVLDPGDALLIPKGWWHSVKSVGEQLNASVNWWFR